MLMRRNFLKAAVAVIAGLLLPWRTVARGSPAKPDYLGLFNQWVVDLIANHSNREWEVRDHSDENGRVVTGFHLVNGKPELIQENFDRLRRVFIKAKQNTYWVSCIVLKNGDVLLEAYKFEDHGHSGGWILSDKRTNFSTEALQQIQDRILAEEFVITLHHDEKCLIGGFAKPCP